MTNNNATATREKSIDLETRHYANKSIKAYTAELFFCADEYACYVCNTYLSKTVFNSDKDILGQFIIVFKGVGSNRNAETLESLLLKLEQSETAGNLSNGNRRLFKTMQPLITENTRIKIRSLYNKYDNKYCRNFDQNFDRVVSDFRMSSPFKGAKILDIGTGFGFFSYVCQRNGHIVDAIDIKNVPEEYNKSTEILKINKREFTIEKYTPITRFAYKFDLVNCTQICFNGHNTDDLWDVDEWMYFLNDLKDNFLTDDGCVRLGFNYDNWVVDGKHTALGRETVDKFFKSYLLNDDADWLIAKLTKRDIAAFK